MEQDEKDTIKEKSLNEMIWIGGGRREGMRPEIMPRLIITLALEAFSAKEAMRIEEEIGDKSTDDRKTDTNEKTDSKNIAHSSTDFQAQMENR